MNEGAPNFEPILPNREEIVSALRDRGINDLEVKAMLVEYVRNLETMTDCPEDNILGDSEKVKQAIHMSQIYFDSNYKQEAIENLTELLEQGIGVPQDLIEEIYDALDRMGWEG